MSHDKSLLEHLLPPSMAAVMLLGSLGAIDFFQNNDIYYETSGRRAVKKVDGFLSHTELELRDLSTTITRFYLMDFRVYEDVDNDGDVDIVGEGERGLFGRTYYKAYYNKDVFPELFQKADVDFRQQIARFKPYLR